MYIHSAKKKKNVNIIIILKKKRFSKAQTFYDFFFFRMKMSELECNKYPSAFAPRPLEIYQIISISVLPKVAFPQSTYIYIYIKHPYALLLELCLNLYIYIMLLKRKSQQSFSIFSNFNIKPYRHHF